MNREVTYRVVNVEGTDGVMITMWMIMEVDEPGR